MLYVPDAVAMKSRPAASALLTVTPMLPGLKEKPLFEALTRYQPLASVPKL
jgi:hypothetical protein